MPRASAFVQLVEALATASAIGAICLGRDADIIAAALHDAEAWDNERRGRGVRRVVWGLETFPVQQYNELFRFEKADIVHLMDALRFPPDEYWVTPSRARFTREEAMLLYLRRMSHPSQLLHIAREGFSAQTGALSELYHMVGEWIFKNHTQRLLQGGLTKWVGRIPAYARAVEKYTKILGFDVFGFIDGTSRAIARPGYFQREFYSGHKRNHCLQFLSVTTPDGMILFTHGPDEGRHQDNWGLHKSGLATHLLPRVAELLGMIYRVYGDPIFARSDYVQKGFPSRVEADATEYVFNKLMNSARVSIEHVFGKVTQLWTFLDFKRTHKLHGTRPAQAYLNAQFLTNVHSCLYGNQVSQQFGIDPPTLAEYLAMEEV